jgi:hypothetical protein
MNYICHRYKTQSWDRLIKSQVTDRPEFIFQHKNKLLTPSITKKHNPKVEFQVNLAGETRFF